jgi:DNA polymerase III subunit delta
MTPEQAIESARRGELRPVTLVIGPERHLSTRVIEALRTAALGGLDLGLNEEHFNAGDVSAEYVIAQARTLPMMARHRFVLVRDCDRWEPKAEGASAKGTAHLDRIAAYAEDPTPSTVLVLAAAKLDARRRLVTAAKKADTLVPCESPPVRALPGWITAAARERGKRLGPGVAQLLADLLGPDLATLDGAVERLALYVGESADITEDAVGDCIVQVKPSTVWELVDAVGRKDVGAALTSLAKVYDPQDRGLRLLGVLAWSTRQLIRFAAARRDGLGPADAAKRAGVPPFKADTLARQVERTTERELEGWLGVLAQIDRDLKGGSRRAPQATLETAIIQMCRSGHEGTPRDTRTRPNA